MGISGKEFPSSVESMARRAARGGEPFIINPLVDFYNAVSLTHMVPVGGFDLDGLESPLELRRTRLGDTFMAIDADTAEPVAVGEVAYATGSIILTRHFVWRQARTGLISPGTRSVFLVSEILGDLGADTAHRVLSDLVAGMQRLFGSEPSAWLLDAGRPQVAW